MFWLFSKSPLAFKVTQVNSKLIPLSALQNRDCSSNNIQLIQHRHCGSERNNLTWKQKQGWTFQVVLKKTCSVMYLRSGQWLWVSTTELGRWMEVYLWRSWHQELGWLFLCTHWFEVARGDFGLLGVVIAADSVCWITFSWWPVSCQPKSIYGSNSEWMTTVWTVCGAEHPKWMLMQKWQIIPWLLRRISDDDCSCGAAPLTLNISASVR